MIRTVLCEQRVHMRVPGTEFVRLPNAGHINVDSGLGDWPLGLALLQSLTNPSWSMRTDTLSLEVT